MNDELGGDSNTSLQLERSNSTALKVNNNMLKSWEAFWPAIQKLFLEPAVQLQWIDFSFNDLRTIDAVSFVLQSCRQSQIDLSVSYMYIKDEEELFGYLDST